MSKQTVIQSFVDSNPNAIFTTTQMCAEVGCTLPTILTFIKNNPDSFNKVSRGTYQILSAQKSMSAGESFVSESSELIVEEVEQIIPQPQLEDLVSRPVFDW